MRRAIAAICALAAVGAGLVLSAGTALADPSANDWATLRQCESSGNYSTDTGNGYYGAYQFDLGTWASVGGSGNPAQASAKEQDYRALYLYRMRGWEPWICASLSGLSDAGDSSARSGKVPSYADSAYMSGGSGDYSEPDTAACNVGKSTAPVWNGVVFVQGQTYRDLICWQRQLGYLGYGLQGSGHFGANTLNALHSFEAAKGLPRTDVIDQRTWIAAWGTSGGSKNPVKTTTPKTTAPKTTTPRPTATSPKPTTTTKPTTSKPVTTAVAVWPGLTATLCHVGAKQAPAWPGGFYTEGDSDRNLACWQMQMGYRGYPLHGNGYYGANTLAAAKDIQDRNHLGGSGLIGPKTWKAAWEGTAKG